MFLWLLTVSLLTQGMDGAMRKYNCTRHQSNIPSPITKRPEVRGAEFQCMEDWNKTCSADSECCSKVCLKPFCKIIGAESTKESKSKETFATRALSDVVPSTKQQVPQELANRNQESPNGCPAFGNDNQLTGGSDNQVIQYNGQPQPELKTTGTSNHNSIRNLIEAPQDRKRRHFGLNDKINHESLNAESIRLPVTFLSRGWLPSGKRLPEPQNSETPHVAINVSVPKTKKPEPGTRTPQKLRTDKKEFSSQSIKKRQTIENLGVQATVGNARDVGLREEAIEPKNYESPQMSGGENDAILQSTIQPSIGPEMLIKAEGRNDRLGNTPQDINESALRSQYRNPGSQRNPEPMNPIMTWVQRSSDPEAVAPKSPYDVVGRVAFEEASS